jgi:hypothetical protein
MPRIAAMIRREFSSEVFLIRLRFAPASARMSAPWRFDGLAGSTTSL